MQPEPRDTNGTSGAAQGGAARLAAAATKATRKTRHTPTPKTGTNTRQHELHAVRPGTDISGVQSVAQAATTDPERPDTLPGSGTPQDPLSATDTAANLAQEIAATTQRTAEAGHASDGHRLQAQAADLVPAVRQARPARGLSLLPATPAPAAEVSMPETVRKALRLSLINQLRAVGAAHRLVAARQAELLAAFTDAREQDFPPREIERIRGEAVGLGFDNAEYTHLLHLTGWLP